MASDVHLPEYVTRLDGRESFTFSCHQGVSCFTDCCRMLELALTPYDVLRLRIATGLTSRALLEDYIIIEQEPGEPFPRLYLTMVDDGRASCVFVSKQGCTVYLHRPSACRVYPLGRAVVRTSNGATTEYFILMKERHCHGFLEPTEQTPHQYIADQELTVYNRFNDRMIQILQHDAIRQGFIPSQKQLDLFILALYNLDSFRELLTSDQLDDSVLSQFDKNLLQNDENLLLFAIDYIHKHLFSTF